MSLLYSGTGSMIMSSLSCCPRKDKLVGDGKVASERVFKFCYGSDNQVWSAYLQVASL